MRTEQELRAHIRRKIMAGALPDHSEPSVWGGMGEDQRCNCCDEPVGASEVQFEFEYPIAGGDRAVCRMHRHCHELWCDELQELCQAGGTPATASPAGDR